MLAIRMQRTGRRGHANFRVIVQDSTQSPASGKVVAHLGSYDPHTKDTILDKEKASFYLEHGAQPSDRIAQLLKKEGVKLPSWVEDATKKSATIRNPEKLRRNRPDEPVVAPSEEAPAAEAAPDAEAEITADAPAAETTEEAAPEVAAEAPAETEAAVEETPVAETPAEEAAPEVAEAAEPEAEKTPEEPVA